MHPIKHKSLKKKSKQRRRRQTRRQTPMRPKYTPNGSEQAHAAQGIAEQLALVVRGVLHGAESVVWVGGTRRWQLRSRLHGCSAEEATSRSFENPENPEPRLSRQLCLTLTLAQRSPRRRHPCSVRPRRKRSRSTSTRARATARTPRRRAGFSAASVCSRSSGMFSSRALHSLHSCVAFLVFCLFACFSST